MRARSLLMSAALTGASVLTLTKVPGALRGDPIPLIFGSGLTLAVMYCIDLIDQADLARAASLEARKVAMRKPPTGWSPCSPEWISAGGDCRTAPRYVANDEHSHWHPNA